MCKNAQNRPFFGRVFVPYFRNCANFGQKTCILCLFLCVILFHISELCVNFVLKRANCAPNCASFVRYFVPYFGIVRDFVQFCAIFDAFCPSSLYHISEMCAICASFDAILTLDSPSSFTIFRDVCWIWCENSLNYHPIAHQVYPYFDLSAYLHVKCTLNSPDNPSSLSIFRDCGVICTSKYLIAPQNSTINHPIAL